MSIIEDVIAKVKQIDPDQPEFHQAVEEVMETLEPTTKRHPGIRQGQHLRAHRGTGADDHLPRSLGG